MRYFNHARGRRTESMFDGSLGEFPLYPEEFSFLRTSPEYFVEKEETIQQVEMRKDSEGTYIVDDVILLVG